MANVLGFVWLVIAYVVTLTSITVWAALMLPGPVERARARIEGRPWRCFWLGALFWSASLALVISLVGQGRPAPVQLLGWLTAGPALAGGVVGGAAFARLLADRLASQWEVRSRILALVGAALCATLAGLLPVVGWFVFQPVVGFIGIGAGVPALFRRRPRERVAEESAAVESPAAPPGALYLPEPAPGASQGFTAEPANMTR